MWLKEKLGVTFSSDPDVKAREMIMAIEQIHTQNLDDTLTNTDELEYEMIEVLAGMESEGVWVDEDKMREIEAQLTNDIAAITEKIFAVTKRPVNLNSPKQLQGFLFEDLQIKPLKKTKTGWSTDEETLRSLAQEHEVCADILTYRHLSKLLGTYAMPLLKTRDSHTGRIHTSYTSMGAAT